MLAQHAARVQKKSPHVLLRLGWLGRSLLGPYGISIYGDYQ
jgi:hypothetical protein